MISTRQATKNGSKSPKKVVSFEQTVFFCHLCPFEAVSHELIQSHLAGAHNQLILRNVKLENVGDVDVSSTRAGAIAIKSELEASFGNYGIFSRNAKGRPRTLDVFIDLTEDD